MTLTPKPNTFLVILEILKILIQKKVKADEYYNGTCQGKTRGIAYPRIRENLLILIQKHQYPIVKNTSNIDFSFIRSRYGRS